MALLNLLPIEVDPATIAVTLDGDFASGVPQVTQFGTLVTNLAVSSGPKSVDIGLPITLDGFGIDKESVGPIFPIPILGAGGTNILEPIGVNIFVGETPRHQTYINIPTILTVRDERNYLFDTPRTIIASSFWS